MSWETAIDELRALLNDGPEDKYRWRKQVYPNPDGTQTTFKTFEFRRNTDFTSSASPLGIYLNDKIIPNDQISGDSSGTGDFILSEPPQDGDKLTATYYVQWFLDSELESFLTSAAEWLSFADSFDALEIGLRPAAKKYAASEAYQKLSLKFADRVSETYRVEDAIDPKVMDAIKSYMELATMFRTDAEKTRDDFYTRSGQSLAPRFKSILGRVKSITPKE